MNDKLIYGFGVNDMPGISSRSKLEKDRKIYSIWFNMIQRCYSSLVSKKYSSYKNCSVCKEWSHLSAFYEWASIRYKVGMELDKDILSKSGGALYSPESCVFVPMIINRFLVNTKPKNKDGLMGTYLRPKTGRFLSQVGNPYTGKCEYIGSYSNEIEGHIAWAEKKLELAMSLNKVCENKAVVDAIIKRQKLILQEAKSCR